MKIRFMLSECLGDDIVFTASVYSIMRQHPDWKIAIKAGRSEVWNNNPDVVTADDTFTDFEVRYPDIDSSNQVSNNYIGAYLHYINTKLLYNIVLQTNRVHLYLSEEEKKKYSELKPYSIIIPSAKRDYTIKAWSFKYYQDIVDHYLGRIQFVQSVERQGYMNQKLENCKHFVDIGIRDMFSLVYNADFVVSHVTSWQHIAAAFEKPYVCISGGREPTTWVSSYPFQHTISSVGSLPCCKHGACWKSRVVALNDGDEKDKSLCERPIFCHGQWVPKCLVKIKPEEVISIIDRII